MQQDDAMHCESDTVCTALLQCMADLWRSPRQKAGVDTIIYTGLGIGVGVGTSVDTGVTVDDTSGVDPVWTITCDW